MNFSKISSRFQAFSFKKIHFKMLSAKWQPFCLGLSVLSKSYWTRNRAKWDWCWSRVHPILTLSTLVCLVNDHRTELLIYHFDIMLKKHLGIGTAEIRLRLTHFLLHSQLTLTMQGMDYLDNLSQHHVYWCLVITNPCPNPSADLANLC